MLTPVEAYLLSSTVVLISNAALISNAVLLSTTNHWLTVAGNIVLSGAGLTLFILEVGRYG